MWRKVSTAAIMTVFLAGSAAIAYAGDPAGGGGVINPTTCMPGATGNGVPPAGSNPGPMTRLPGKAPACKYGVTHSSSKEGRAQSSGYPLQTTSSGSSYKKN